MVGGDEIMATTQRILRERGDALLDDSPTVVVLDFAGQRMYYTLHQIVITEALTRYVVAVSLEHDLDAALHDPEDQVFGMTHGENLDFWLNSIHSGAPSAPILLVVTKLDLVPEVVSEAQRDARVAAIKASLRGKPYERQITSVLCVSSKTGEGMDAVRAVLDDTSRLQHYGDEVPLKWFKWKSLISEVVARDGDDGSNRRISHKQAVQMAGACGIDESDVDEMLAKFHSVGFLLWHSGTHDLIVIDPQWMLDRMTELLCQRSIAELWSASADKKDAWSELQSSGRLSLELLPEREQRRLVRLHQSTRSQLLVQH